ncbi:alpha-amylase [Ktedonosporobacter rubrisoli]|uniref:Alpha-amylase n=1 Tax=Ktedonosporobacter rubrisoli TaxID=2509675 RepID=A0A4P6JLC8_KTERU|nr:alpha-amylase family glycosyl hydrolase [Ktedonosporobacter rubrisoli]QBD75994.1 alpha-amylase [Ktedonosporobacter rubrisoli]
MNQPQHAVPWWQSGVIYHLYVRSFKDSDGDGNGDLAGILQQLDYLSETLKVDALWLSPVYPSGGIDAGYDVTDHTNLDPLFGDLSLFDRLLAEVHRRALRVILDFIPNHTSDRHPWFLASRSSREHPKRDWYVWADAQEDGSAPNNWLSHWGGSAWEWDAHTRQYYLHTFHKAQPDLNWRCQALKEAMFAVVSFWLDRGMDGLRIDSAHYILKDPALRDNPPNLYPELTAYKPLGEYDSQLHLYDRDHADTHGIYRDLRRLLDEYERLDPHHPRLMLGEVSLFDWSQWVTYYGAALDELHMPFNFGLLGAIRTAREVRQVVDAVESILPAGAWPCYVLGNHDESRIASRVGEARARIAMMLLLTLRGTPVVYYGDEIGMHDVHIPASRIQDPWELRVPGQGFGRDPERTPMQWDKSTHAGFCQANALPWLPLAEDAKECNVASQLADASSMLTLTRSLIHLRHSSTALTVGSYSSFSQVPEGCLVYERSGPHERWLIALNFTNEEQFIRLAEGSHGYLVLSTHLDRQGAVDLSVLSLRANEGCLIVMEIQDQRVHLS